MGIGVDTSAGDGPV